MPNVKGPYFHQGSGRWRVRIDGADVYHESEEAAIAHLEELRGPAPELEARGTPGSSEWWSSGLAALGAAVLANPHDRDLQASLRCFAQGAQASEKVADTTKLEEGLRRMERRFRELTSARDNKSHVQQDAGLPKRGDPVPAPPVGYQER